MHLLLFGGLVLIGLFWQARLVQNLVSNQLLWAKHMRESLTFFGFPLMVVALGKLLGAGFFQSLAIPALIIYLLAPILILTSTSWKELQENPSSATAVVLPLFLGSLIAMGATLQAVFEWQATSSGPKLFEFAAVNEVALNALAFAFLFQVKALFSPIVVCINVAWSGFIYLKTGNVEPLSAMENMLLLVLQPAQAASAAPWYVGLMFVLAAVATLGEALKAASNFE